MNPELKEYLDAWFATRHREFDDLMDALRPATRTCPADHAISTPAVDSTCGVVGPVQANCDRTELVPVPATHHGSSSPTNISLETLGVDPSACTGFITTVPATCSTDCVAQTIPVFTAAAASDGTFVDEANGWCDSSKPRPMPWPSWLKTASAPATAPTTLTAIVDITKRYVFVSHEANKNGVLSMVTTNCDDTGEDQRPSGPPIPLVLVYVMSELKRDKVHWPPWPPPLPLYFQSIIVVVAARSHNSGVACFLGTIDEEEQFTYFCANLNMLKKNRKKPCAEWEEAIWSGLISRATRALKTGCIPWFSIAVPLRCDWFSVQSGVLLSWASLLLVVFLVVLPRQPLAQHLYILDLEELGETWILIRASEQEAINNGFQFQRYMALYLAQGLFFFDAPTKRSRFLCMWQAHGVLHASQLQRDNMALVFICGLIPVGKLSRNCALIILIQSVALQYMTFWWSTTAIWTEFARIFNTGFSLQFDATCSFQPFLTAIYALQDASSTMLVLIVVFGGGQGKFQGGRHMPGLDRHMVLRLTWDPGEEINQNCHYTSSKFLSTTTSTSYRRRLGVKPFLKGEGMLASFWPGEARRHVGLGLGLFLRYWRPKRPAWPAHERRQHRRPLRPLPGNERRSSGRIRKWRRRRILFPPQALDLSLFLLFLFLAHLCL